MRKNIWFFCLLACLLLQACAIGPPAALPPDPEGVFMSPITSSVSVPAAQETPPAPLAAPTAAQPTPTVDTPAASAVAAPTLQPTATPAAPAIEATPLPNRLQQPRIRIEKAARRLYLYDGETLVATFPVALGFSPVGHKQAEGDGKTPEGTYYVCTRNAQSSYYLSLGLSYPNAQDARAALAQGRIDAATCDAICSAIDRGQRPPWNTPLGGAIMIHGCGAHFDWTAGCIAVENADMDALWQLCPGGTPVEIVP